MMRTMTVLALAVVCGCGSGGDSPRRTKAKTYLNRSEARAGLGQLAHGVTNHFARSGTLPVSAPWTPALGSCCNAEARETSRKLREEGSKCPPRPELWQVAPWNLLGFSRDEPHRASYSLEVDGATVIARAKIDIDCDGTYATFEQRLSVDGQAIAEGEVVTTDPAE